MTEISLPFTYFEISPAQVLLRFLLHLEWYSTNAPVVNLELKTVSVVGCRFLAWGVFFGFDQIKFGGHLAYWCTQMAIKQVL